MISLPSSYDVDAAYDRAFSSLRKRYAEIMHNKGAIFNRVFNFILKDSYMHPHCHPGCEKVEHITILKGKAKVIFFDNSGTPTNFQIIDENNSNTIIIPAFRWHTYVMLSEKVLTYETMLGFYEPSSWKHMAAWAPNEQSKLAHSYLNTLRDIH